MITIAKSHIDKVKVQHQKNAELVKLILDWNTEQYNEFQYYAGLNYANYITGGDEMGLDMLISTKQYWGWWRNEWSKRDDDFITDHVGKTNTRMLHEEYNFSNTQALTIGKMGEIMDKMGAAVMGAAIDEVMKGGATCTL